MSLTLVTGGSGFIGSHLVRQLIAAGDQVRVLDLDPPRGDNLQDIAFFQGSILDTALLDSAMEGVDHLYHLAANPQLWAPRKTDFMTTNHLGTLQVLQAARRYGVGKIIYTSTESILGSYRRSGHGLIDESTPLPVLREMPGPYTRSKWHAEREVRQRAGEGWPIVIVYPTTPVGPGDHNMTAPTRMIRDFAGSNIPAYYNTCLNWIDVRDAARGHLLAARKAAPGSRYLLGGENLSLQQLLQMLETGLQRPMPKRHIPYLLAWSTAVIAEFFADLVTKKPPVASLEGVRLARAGLQFDCRRVRKELGLRPRPIAPAVLKTVRWLQSRGWITNKPKAPKGPAKNNFPI